MRKLLISLLLCCIGLKGYSWGFFAHQRINYYSVLLLPPEMMVLFKSNIQFLSDHATDPDKRRYVIPDEAPRHYIDIDYYGAYPYKALPRKWDEAVKKYTEDTLKAYGIVPWWIAIMQQRLTSAFKENDHGKILKLAADIGHYIADAHVPLHACSNHDGQLSNQKGIHAFWESRVPELLADKDFDFMIGKAQYVSDVSEFMWKRILESGAAADTVLKAEAELTKQFRDDQKYAFEERSGKLVRQYSSAFTVAFNNRLNNMVEKRMRQSILAIASVWYTAWVNAGQPDLKKGSNVSFTEADLKEFEALNLAWKTNAVKGRAHE